MRTRIDFPSTFSFVELFSLFYYQSGINKKDVQLHDRPFGSLVIQIEKFVKKYNLTEQIKSQIETLLIEPPVAAFVGEDPPNTYWGGDMSRAVKKLKRLLHATDENGVVNVPAYELGSGPIGSVIKQDIQTLTEEDSFAKIG